FVEALLDGTEQLEGLAVDQDLRWSLVTSLAAAGRAGDRIEQELAQDSTISGQEHAAAARAAQPDADAKAEAWRLAVLDESTPNETARSIVFSFVRTGQEELLAPYVEKYLTAGEQAWEHLGTHRASTVLGYIFPTPLASPELVEKVESWLATTEAPIPAQRYVREGLADAQRALAAQACDAAR
ncbi:MAG: ERAP1-like C-terminal domain-containing protein, partial [Nocardioides sp.]|nr:ERAP1-like C-terminal domain-containing protein [Nocardioides sp.]